MDNDKAIVLAMASAVASNYQPNAFYTRRPVEETYLTLRRYLADKYPSVGGDILDVGPASPERQAILAQQLRDSGAADDPHLLALAATLANLVIRRDPIAPESVFSNLDDLQSAYEAIKN
ncbi:MAG: hypothetical protein LC131_14080 [Anaerolineae bacterium]|nr:hypothetical protein [Anaerolineae bacterium]